MEERKTGRQSGVGRCGKLRPDSRGKDVTMVNRVLSLVAAAAVLIVSTAPAWATVGIPVPEPDTLLLLAAGAGGLALWRRLRNRR
jgi:hypothetical protein